MGTESRTSTPTYNNTLESGGIQRSRRSLKKHSQKGTIQNNGNSKSNINLTNLNNVKDSQNRITLSPDDMLSQIETNVRISDLNNNPNNGMYNYLDETNINKYYSLNANLIPPYVLARLIKQNIPNELIKSNNNINLINYDPFTSTFVDTNHNDNVQWGEFLHSIKIPTSSVPVKASTVYDDPSYEDGGYYFNSDGDNLTNDGSEIDQLDDGIQSYRPSLDSFNDKDNINNVNNQQLMHEIFKSYDFHSKWKGGNRLKGLFEATDSIESDRISDESSISDTSIEDNNNNENYNNENNLNDQINNNNNNNNNNIDLEKGHKNRLKKTRLRMHRHKRERDIKERAKYWLLKNKKTWKPRLLDSIMTNSYFPLFFRLISITLSTIALGLASRLVKVTERLNVSQQPSPLMATIVQAIGIIYLLYITYDEFTSQPLGLRNPTAKIRLVMLDLLFIIFSSANLSLSFQSIFDSRWVCISSTLEGELMYDSMMCKKVKALTAFLFLTLVAWCINFTISVFRIVHAVSYSRNKS